MNRSWIRLAMAVALGGFMLPAATSAAPMAIGYTGELLADNGLPYNGEVGVVVRLFDTAMSTDVVWEQDLGPIVVMGGVLDVELGGMGNDLTPLLTGASSAWFEFEIDGETLAPRQKVTSVPFARVAAEAESLNGFVATDFAMANADVGADSLPTDGINQVSNGALVNKFLDVPHVWAGGPMDIFDAEPASPPPATTASITTGETAGSYATAIAVRTQIALNFNSQITMVLTPPASTGAAAITLRSSEPMLGGAYDEMWTIDTAPALADLLGKQLAGTWTLTVTDDASDAVGSPAIGELQAFDISYDVVRADHMVINGRLDVTGMANIDGNANILGYQARKVWRHSFQRGHSSSNSSYVKIGGSTFTFNKQWADTDLLIHWNDNLRALGGGTALCEWRIRIDEADCSAPYAMNLGLHSSPSDNNIHYPAAFVQTCNEVGGTKIAPGPHEVSIWVRAASGDCWTGHGVSGSGAGLTTGLITVEEVY